MVSRIWLMVALLAPPTPLAPLAPLTLAWREAPALARMFTPRHVPEGSYRAYISDLSLEEALKQVTSEPAMSGWREAWRIESVAPADAFGEGAAYDRWTVARLYAGTPARVARGPRIDSGQPVEAWTLISPYPDATLGRLDTGTLLIVLTLR